MCGSSPEPASEFEEDLRKCTRDLVALSTLSALWTEYDPRRIARGLADVLHEMLPLQFVYVRLWNPDGGAPIEAATGKKGENVLAETQSIGRAFMPALQFGAAPRAIRNPVGDGTVVITAVPVGRQAESGVIVPASRRRGFPSETERLLLTVAANQTAVVAGYEQTAQQTRAERVRWRELLLQAPAAIAFLRGPDLVFELVNAEYARATGRAEAMLVGKPVRQALPELAGQGSLELVEEVYRTGLPSFGNEKLMKLDRQGEGTLENRFFNFAYQPSKDATGQTQGVLVHAVDVTEQVVARQCLEESKHQLSTLADSIAQMAWMAEPDGQRFWYNQRWYEFTGTTPEQMQGWGWQSVHHPQILPTVLERWRNAQRTGSAFEIEHPIRGADGVFGWFLTRVVPLRDAEGRIIRWFGTNTDITELKRIRDERAALLYREREARETAELLNRVGPTLVGELELTKLVQAVTDLAAQLTGAEFGSFFPKVESAAPNSLFGAPVEACSGFPMPRMPGVFEPTLMGETAVRSDDIGKDPRYGNSAGRYGSPKGSPAVRSYLAAPVISRSGEVLGGLFFGHSAPSRFTERHEAIVTGIAAQAAIAIDNARLFEEAQRVQSELTRSNAELRRANKDLETFAYSASHDLQEPLRNVALCGQLLQVRFGAQLEGDGAKLLDSMLAGARRMENLVKDLLAYSRVTKSAEGLPRGADAGAVLTGVLQALKTSVEETAAVITAGALPVVAVHDFHLAELFQNLISNALKYKNKEAPRVHVSAAVQQDGWCVFSVADNGIGIDQKYRNQIFGLFKRLHSRDEYPGNGVGLAICQRIVELYGGRIWLERSVLGEGSIFSFGLPCRVVY
jgi:PAS domain S-box-containing protein